MANKKSSSLGIRIFVFIIVINIVDEFDPAAIGLDQESLYIVAIIFLVIIAALASRAYSLIKATGSSGEILEGFFSIPEKTQSFNEQIKELTLDATNEEKNQHYKQKKRHQSETINQQTHTVSGEKETSSHTPTHMKKKYYIPQSIGKDDVGINQKNPFSLDGT